MSYQLVGTILKIDFAQAQPRRRLVLTLIRLPLFLLSLWICIKGVRTLMTSGEPKPDPAVSRPG